MAKRQRQYRGTPEQHRREAAEELINVRRAVRETHRAIKQGKCPMALDFLIVAENSWGGWEASRRHAGKKRPNKAYAPIALRLLSAKRALKAVCFR